MRVSILLLPLLLFSACSTKQVDHSYLNEILQVQTELNDFYSNPETSPLKGSELISFKENGGHSFFEINPNYKVKAHLLKAQKPDTIFMPTSSDVVKAYDAYGIAEFTLLGKAYQLTLYQSHSLRQSDEYKNYLFLPFKDMTSGQSTYGGGRYIDLSIPAGDSIDIDFNKAYHPYCAYTKGYSCPVPPANNFLNLPIEAGIKLTKK